MFFLAKKVTSNLRRVSQVVRVVVGFVTPIRAVRLRSGESVYVPEITQLTEYYSLQTPFAY